MSYAGACCALSCATLSQQLTPLHRLALEKSFHASSAVVFRALPWPIPHQVPDFFPAAPFSVPTGLFLILRQKGEFQWWFRVPYTHSNPWTFSETRTINNAHSKNIPMFTMQTDPALSNIGLYKKERPPVKQNKNAGSNPGHFHTFVYSQIC